MPVYLSIREGPISIDIDGDVVGGLEVVRARAPARRRPRGTFFFDAESASAEYADCQVDPQGSWEDATVKETGQWRLETEAMSRYIAGPAYVYGTPDTTASSYEVQ
jgi:hypothetical protein